LKNNSYIELFFLSQDVKNILKVASIYMATVIGAGFASGQEIMQFFSSYYEGGFYGIVLAKSLQRKNKKLRGIPFSQRRMGNWLDYGGAGQFYA